MSGSREELLAVSLQILVAPHPVATRVEDSVRALCAAKIIMENSGTSLCDFRESVCEAIRAQFVNGKPPDFRA
jgi:hypothetical protein